MAGISCPTGTGLKFWGAAAGPAAQLSLPLAPTAAQVGEGRAPQRLAQGFWEVFEDLTPSLCCVLGFAWPGLSRAVANCRGLFMPVGFPPPHPTSCSPTITCDLISGVLGLGLSQKKESKPCLNPLVLWCPLSAQAAQILPNIPVIPLQSCVPARRWGWGPSTPLCWGFGCIQKGAALPKMVLCSPGRFHLTLHPNRG